MKKGRRIISFALALCILLSTSTAYAWPSLRADHFGAWTFLFYKGKEYTMFGGDRMGYGGYTSHAYFYEIPEDGSYELEWKDVSFRCSDYYENYESETSHVEWEQVIEGDVLDLSVPTPVITTGRWGSDDCEHRTCIFLIGSKKIPWTDEDYEIWMNQAKEVVECQNLVLEKRKEYDAALEQEGIRVGGHHPIYAELLLDLTLMTTRIPTSCSAWDSVWGKEEDPYTVESLQEEMQYWYTRNDHLKNGMPNPRTGQTMQLVHALIDYWFDYVENNRIAAPEIQEVSLGDYYGVIDSEDATAVITIPDGIAIKDLGDVEIGVEGQVKYNLINSDASGKIRYYNLCPYEENTGITYDGIDDSWENGRGGDVNLGRTWLVRIQTGEPLLEVRDFSVTLDGTVYSAKIDEENHAISLLLPSGTDLKRVPAPQITHTAQRTNLADTGTIDFTSQENQTLVLTTEAAEKEYTQSYSLEIRAGESQECEILSYRIGETEGVVGGDTVQIELPYGTSLEGVNAEIEVSENASWTGPAKLVYGSQTYTVTAQDGTRKNWTVTITESTIATGREITSFTYGSIQGVVNQTEGTITLQLPAGTDLTRLKPTIEVSPYAMVSPASGESVDASSPISYTVTSQSGATKIYELIIKQEETAENPYKEELKRNLTTIIDYYRGDFVGNCGDWEWFDIGNYYRTYRGVSGIEDESLVANYNIYNLVNGINSSKMTDYERVVLGLTAMGINASDLDAYGNGERFTVGSGAAVSDLVEAVYNYPEENPDINEAVFALLALDSGNYTVPANAVWTRERLLEEILNYNLAAGDYGVDMMGMVMTALAPYRNHAAYGSQVQKKLEEGLDGILKSMSPGYTFKYGSDTASESSSWVMMGLCSMGIDCCSDPRFGDGTAENNVLSKWMQFRVRNGSRVTGFAHTLNSGWNKLASYEGCYALQCYLDFLNNGGTGNLHYPWYHLYDFGEPLNDEAEILSFILEGQEAEIVSTDTEHSVKVTLPMGTSLTNMTPKLVLSDGASLESPKLPVTFVDGEEQYFHIVAEDGMTRTQWSVTVTLSEDAAQTGTTLDTESIALKDAGGRTVTIQDRHVTPTGAGAEVLLTVADDVDITKLRLLADLPSPGAVSDVDLTGGELLDLSNWVDITVTSGDGEHTGVYRIKVQQEEYAAITGFSLSVGGTSYPGTISGTEITVSGVPSDADVTAAVPTVTLSEKTTVCSPLSGVPNDFTTPQKYTVNGPDVKSRTYTVTVVKDDDPGGENPPPGDGEDPPPGDGENPPPGDGEDPPPGDGENPPPGDGEDSAASAEITSFRVLGRDGEIDNDARTIVVTLPQGTDVHAVSPTIAVTSGWTVSPASGSVVDLTSPVVYTLTDGTNKITYTVIVRFQKTTSQQLWEKMESNENNTITDYQVVR